MARYFDEEAFDDGFAAELEQAAEVEARLCAAAPAFAPHVFDVTFVSDDKKQLAALAKVLTGAGYRMAAPVRADHHWEGRGQSMPLPVAEDTVVCWAIDLYSRGFEYDCRLDAYEPQAAMPAEPPKSGEAYFNEALAAYERGNRGLAIALFSVALAVEPANPNTWYSRACLKDQLDLGASARSDYDKALELAPSFSAALVNRGANKDLADEYDAAIADYDRAIALNAQDAAAFLNRGNSKFNKGDKAAAIADWKIAAGLGDASAKKRLAAQR